MISLEKITEYIKLRSRFIYGAVGVVIFGIVCFTIWWFINLPVFKFDEVRISAKTKRSLLHVDTALTRKEMLEQVKGNFFTANLSEIRSTFEHRPWVRSANVRREWPNKLIVEVEEYQPLGLWGADGQLISVTGDVFVVNLDEAEEEVRLFDFKGPSGSERLIVSQFANFQVWFNEMKLKPIAITLSERHNWRVTLSNGLIVDLGRDDGKNAVRARFDRFKIAYTRLDAGIQGGISYIDLRYPNGMAVKSNVPITVKK